MKPEINTETAETVQTGSDQAVDPSTACCAFVRIVRGWWRQPLICIIMLALEHLANKKARKAKIADFQEDRKKQRQMLTDAKSLRGIGASAAYHCLDI